MPTCGTATRVRRQGREPWPALAAQCSAVLPAGTCHGTLGPGTCRVALVDGHLVEEALLHHLDVAALGRVVEGAGAAVAARGLQVVAGHLAQVGQAALATGLTCPSLPLQRALHQSVSDISST